MKMVLTRLGKLEIQPDDLEMEITTGDYIKARVLSCAICRTDAKMWEQGHRDLLLPRVLGHEMVVRGENGQRYVVWPGKSCGICRFCSSGRENLCEKMEITGFHSDGGFAGSVVLPRKSLIPIPDNLDTHVACFAKPVGCVINAFEKLSFEKGEKILIYGAGTMGLVTALYAGHLGLIPVVVEKNETKIKHIARFLQATGIECIKDTSESKFDLVINTCADFAAFSQGIVKVNKGGEISFFSGITKNEQIETNLLNLIHYKEARISGVYGMTAEHMKRGIVFMLTFASDLERLIEKIVSPYDAPVLMADVLSGEYLKFILDFDLVKESPETDMVQAGNHPDTVFDDLDTRRFSRKIIESIEPLSDKMFASATTKIDNKTKPLGALGRMEALAVQMSMIQNSLNPEISQKNLFIFAGDHGITEEGVSAFPSEVTAQMVNNFLNGGAAINVLCRHHGIQMKVVDMGVNKEFSSHEDLVRKKVGRGTRNFAIEDAMTKEQAIESIESGMSTFLEAYEKNPIDIVGVGEMGIGNTSSAAAIISVITGISAARAAGRGTGVDDAGLEHKIEVIEKALHFHTLNPSDGFEIVQKVGGFEIAGITGAVLAAASKKTAVVLDGVISTAAGLLAYIINPAVKGYLISGHKSVEKAQMAALSYMKLDPLIDFNMRLGEGTGAALAIDLTDAACKIMTQMASFDEAKIARSFID